MVDTALIRLNSYNTEITPLNSAKNKFLQSMYVFRFPPNLHLSGIKLKVLISDRNCQKSGSRKLLKSLI